MVELNRNHWSDFPGKRSLSLFKNFDEQKTKQGFLPELTKDCSIGLYRLEEGFYKLVEDSQIDYFVSTSSLQIIVSDQKTFRNLFPQGPNSIEFQVIEWPNKNSTGTVFLKHSNVDLPTSVTGGSTRKPPIFPMFKEVFRVGVPANSEIFPIEKVFSVKPKEIFIVDVLLRLDQGKPTNSFIIEGFTNSSPGSLIPLSDSQMVINCAKDDDAIGKFEKDLVKLGTFFHLTTSQEISAISPTENINQVTINGSFSRALSKPQNHVFFNDLSAFSSQKRDFINSILDFQKQNSSSLFFLKVFEYQGLLRRSYVFNSRDQIASNPKYFRFSLPSFAQDIRVGEFTLLGCERHEVLLRVFEQLGLKVRFDEFPTKQADFRAKGEFLGLAIDRFLVENGLEGKLDGDDIIILKKNKE